MKGYPTVIIGNTKKMGYSEELIDDIYLISDALRIDFEDIIKR